MAPWMIYWQQNAVWAGEPRTPRQRSWDLGAGVIAMIAMGSAVLVLGGLTPGNPSASTSPAARLFHDGGHWSGILFAVGLFDAGLLAACTISLTSLWTLREAMGQGARHHTEAPNQGGWRITRNPGVGRCRGHVAEPRLGRARPLGTGPGRNLDAGEPHLPWGSGEQPPSHGAVGDRAQHTDSPRGAGRRVLRPGVCRAGVTGRPGALLIFMPPQTRNRWRLSDRRRGRRCLCRKVTTLGTKARTREHALRDWPHAAVGGSLAAKPALVLACTRGGPTHNQLRAPPCPPVQRSNRQGGEQPSTDSPFRMWRDPCGCAASPRMTPCLRNGTRDRRAEPYCGLWISVRRRRSPVCGPPFGAKRHSRKTCSLSARWLGAMVPSGAQAQPVSKNPDGRTPTSANTTADSAAGARRLCRPPGGGASELAGGARFGPPPTPALRPAWGCSGRTPRGRGAASSGSAGGRHTSVGRTRPGQRRGEQWHPRTGRDGMLAWWSGQALGRHHQQLVS